MKFFPFRAVFPPPGALSGAGKARQHVTSLLFCLAMMLLFFRFCRVRLGDAAASTFTGIDLIIGSLRQRHSGGGDTWIWALFPFIMAVTGLALPPHMGRRSGAIRLMTAVVGAASLFILKAALGKAVLWSPVLPGGVTIDFLSGYWGCLACFVSVALWSSFRVVPRDETVAYPQAPAAPHIHIHISTTTDEPPVVRPEDKKRLL